MRILLLNAHPDEGSLSDAIAAAYAQGARDAGHQVRCVRIRELQFDLVLHGGYQSVKPLEPDILEQQELIQWCGHLVIVTPNWWWSAPALLKRYIDRVFLPNFAMRVSCRLSVRRTAAEGPFGAGALHAKCIVACGLAVSQGSVLAVDLGGRSRTLRVFAGPPPGALRRKGHVPAEAGSIPGFGERVRTAGSLAILFRDRSFGRAIRSPLQASGTGSGLAAGP